MKEERILEIKIFYIGKPLVIKSKELITLTEIKEKSIKYFKINDRLKDSIQFIVKDNDNSNADKIYILSDDDIIKYSKEKDRQNLTIELLLTFDKDIGTKNMLMNIDKGKNNQIIIDNNIKNIKEKNTFKIICNKSICIEGNMMKKNELNIEINKYKEDLLKLQKQIQILTNGLKNYKEKIKKLEEENLKLKEKIDNLNKEFELDKQKKIDYINELEEKIKNYENSKYLNIDYRNETIKKLIKEEKVIDINIQNNLEKSYSNEQKLNLLNSINKPTLKPFEKESSPILQNKGNSNYNNKIGLNPVDFCDKAILEMELNLNDNNNINIEESINKDKKRNCLSRNNEEIKKEISILNNNPKTEIRKRTKKNLDIDKINKIRNQCGDQVKNYSDEKIQKILDENGGIYLDTITDIMLRLSKIIYK